MAVVRMPQLGESITEGTIAHWLKQVGEPVKKYESLVEVITDKVNAEVPAPLSGILKEIKVQEGATVAVGTEICIIEEVTAGVAKVDAGQPPGAARAPAEIPAESRPGRSAAPVPSPGEEEGGTRLSPAVRALIEEHGITDAELARVAGSGAGGRITRKDIEDYLAQRDRAPTAAPAPRAEESLPITPIRRSIATNMVRSKQTIPHAWTVAEVDMTSVVRVRQQVKDRFREQEGVDLTYVPILIRGVAEGLRANPLLNASWGEDRIILHREINIGVAVSIDEGLIVPVIHRADQQSIATLARSVDDLARRARAGKLTLPDVQGGTFTVNNPGTFGNVLSYAIIAPPQAAILSMEAIVKRPVAMEEDAVRVRSMMNLCLSFDHRVMDGAAAARFLQGLRRWLEAFSEAVPLR